MDMAGPKSQTVDRMTKEYIVTVIRRIKHAVDANDAIRAAESGAGEIVDIEVSEE